MENQYNNEDKKILAEKIRTIIFLESAKSDDEIDIDLIEECVDFLMELEGREDISKEQIELAKNKVFNSAKSNIVNIHETKKKRSFKALLVAACIAVVLLVANFTAMAFGVDTVAILKEFGNCIVEMFAGEKDEFKGVTIIKNDVSLKYDSVEEFFKEEKLEVLYPTKFPDGVEFSHVQIVEKESKIETGKNYFNINFVTNSPETYMYITTEKGLFEKILQNKELNKKEIDGFTCYVKKDKFCIQYNIIHNNQVYAIVSPTEENIITIINNLREIK